MKKNNNHQIRKKPHKIKLKYIKITRCTTFKKIKRRTKKPQRYQNNGVKDHKTKAAKQGCDSSVSISKRYRCPIRSILEEGTTHVITR